MKDMAEHVAYEAFMLSGATQLIEQNFPPPDRVLPKERDVVRNALLESVLVHARALEDFLSRERPAKGDDVVAVDFLPTWGRRCCLTQQDRDYINKRTMHLTTLRGDGPAPWDLNKSNVVFRNFVDFLRALHACDPSSAAWFSRYVQFESSDP